MHYDLGEKRIVGNARLITHITKPIGSNSGSVGRLVSHQASGTRPNTAIGGDGL